MQIRSSRAVSSPALQALDGAAIVRALSAGDACAREAIYRAHFGAVWNTALRLLGNRADAEDVVQDTFLTAFRDIHALRDANALGAWLLQVTVHQAHRRFRHRRFSRSLGFARGAVDSTLDHVKQQEPDAEVRADLDRLDSTLRRLPATQRAAWVWRRVQGCSLVETAAACGCSLATAKRRIRAADERIREHLDFRNGNAAPGSSAFAGANPMAVARRPGLSGAIPCPDIT